MAQRKVRAPFRIEPYTAECLVWELLDALGHTLALLSVRKFKGKAVSVSAKWFE